MRIRLLVKPNLELILCAPGTSDLLVSLLLGLDLVPQFAVLLVKGGRLRLALVHNSLDFPELSLQHLGLAAGFRFGVLRISGSPQLLNFFFFFFFIYNYI
jgi:hypothetical protein